MLSAKVKGGLFRTFSKSFDNSTMWNVVAHW